MFLSVALGMKTIWQLYYSAILLFRMDPVSQDLSSEWIPVLPATPGPRYLAFVQSLEKDIESGALKSGTRLLPQRDMASQLGLSVGTISKAYSEAESRRPYFGRGWPRHIRAGGGVPQ